MVPDDGSAGVVAELFDLMVGSFEDEATQPFSETHFCYQVTASVSEPGSPGVDQFGMNVCSPSWFATERAWVRKWSNVFLIWDRHPGILPGNGFWFMDRWDRDEVEQAIRLICERSSPAPDWDRLANRIGRLIPWEFAGIADDGENRDAGLPPTPSPAGTAKVPEDEQDG